MSNLLAYSEEQIIERLRFENPWWSTKKIDQFYADMKPRLYFDLFFPLIEKSKARRAVVLMGPRRVGKTVMIYHAIRGLLEKKINAQKIAFVSVETPIYNNIGLEELFSYCRKAAGKKELDGWYIFFDEIQYLKNWEVHLKSLVDSYPNTHFVVSGSAAAALKLKSNESGAGRFTDFILPPLTFIEFLDLKNKLVPGAVDLESFDIKELNNEFFEYINFGGYPEVIFSQEIQNNPGRYIRHDIIDKVLLRDLPMLYGIRDIQELNSLFAVIAYNSGNEFSLEALNQNSHISKEDIKKYLEYLEAAFLIKIVNKVSNKPKEYKRIAQFKIYLTNPSLRSALFTPLSPLDSFACNMVETAIFAQYFDDPNKKLYYARWQGGEVDMVDLDEKNLNPQNALEIKWSDRFFKSPKDLKPLIKFAKDNNIKKVCSTTINFGGNKNIGDLEIKFIPAAHHAFLIGAHKLSKNFIKYHG